MKRQIQSLAVISALLLVSLMASTTYKQFFQENYLKNNAYNSRQIYEEFGKPRGEILAHGKEGDIKLAWSEPVEDSFQYARKYDDSKVFSPITGFYSIANRADRGIEAAMNDELNGDISQLAWTNFRDFVLRQPHMGANVITTIDADLQKTAYNALNDKGLKGAIVAIEPKTGRILALASTPSYDANDLAMHDTGLAGEAYKNAATNDDQPLLNKAIDDVYPPGSTFKIVTSAAAFETGGYKPATIVDSPNSWRLPGTDVFLPNYAGESCGGSATSTIQTALAISCNTTFAILGTKIGNAGMDKQAEKFGIGQKFTLAGKDNPMAMTTVASRFPTQTNSKLSEDKLALSSIGQGDVALTPIQDAMISAAVANKGHLMTPYLIDEVESKDGQSITKNFPSKFQDAFSETTAADLQTMMVNDVTNGIVSPAGVKGLKVAGKTGTAENDPTLDPHAWFTGFAPVDATDDQPQIAISIFIEHGGISTIASNLAHDIFSVYFKEKGIL